MRNSSQIELIGYVHDLPKCPMKDTYPHFVSFVLSVTKKWKDNKGEEKKSVEWFKCNSWQEGLSKMILDNVKPGAGLLIKGTPKANPYVDKEGNPKASIDVTIREINILSYSTEEKTVAKAPEFIDDEIPF